MTLANILLSTIRQLNAEGVSIHQTRKPLADFVECGGRFLIPGNFYRGKKIEVPTIILSRMMRIHEKLPILFHEEGHYRCWLKNCRCMQGRSNISDAEWFRLLKKSLLSELHAHQFALGRCFDLHLGKSTDFYMSLRNDKWPQNISSGEGILEAINATIYPELIKSRIWKKCLKWRNCIS